MDQLQYYEKIFKIFSSRKRLNILKFLKKRHSATVKEIADEIGLKMQATSKHLRLLRLAGILESKRRVLFVTYRLSLKQDKVVKQVLSLL